MAKRRLPYSTSLPTARLLLLTSLTLGGFSLSYLPALAAGSTENALYRFDIPAGPLERVLNQFASAAHAELSVDAALLRGRNSAGLQGSVTLREGFARLLSAHGLQAVRQANGTYTLEALSQSQGSLQLPVTEISSGLISERADGPVQGYVAKRSATGSKTDTPIIEIPQSISVVTREEVSAFKSQNLTDALAYTAGIYRSEGNDRTADRLNLRGFGGDAIEGSIYRDGTRYMVNAFNGKQEPYGLERIEVLKGAASVLYGSAAPGGIINTVTKRPEVGLRQEVGLEVGSHDRRQVTFDVGGALSDDEVWSYRLTGLQRDSDTFVDHVPDDRFYIAPALKWQPSSDTSLTLLSHYQKTKSKYVFGLPPQGTIYSNPNGRIPVGRYIGEPDRDYYENEIHSLGYLLEHAFSDTLKLRNNVSLFNATSSMPATWPMGATFTDQSMSTISRFAESKREDHSRAFNADLSLQYDWQLGETANTLLVGTDRTIQHHRSERWLNFPADLNLYAPVYNVPYASTEFMRGYPASRKERFDQSGVYIQNQMKIAEKWVLLLGGRQDWAERGMSPIRSQDNWSREKSDAFTRRAGLVYLADNGLAPFVSWSESFQPQAGVDRSGQRFEPTTGTQYELGLRYQPPGRDMLLSAAVYQLTRQNVTTSDPVDSAFQVQTGEMRSRGLELEAKVQANRYLNLIGAYTYIDAQTTRSNVPQEVGRRTGAVPRHQATLWNQLDFTDLGAKGLKAGLGVRYMGSSTGTYIDVKVPAFTLVDAMLSYETGPWLLGLNAYNLTDKVHVTNCIDVCYYGEPRRVIGSLAYRW